MNLELNDRVGMYVHWPMHADSNELEKNVIKKTPSKIEFSQRVKL